MSETESLTTNEIFSSGKRSAASILSSSPSPRSDYASLRPANGILKGSRSRQNTLMRRAIFNQTITYNDVHDFRSPEAESKYFEALYKRKFNMAYEMRKQGLMLSGSNLCFSYMNSILRSEHDCRGILTFLLKNQPNVFFQPFDCGQNVFYNATQFNINFLMERTAHIPGAQMMIFKEVLRNPELTIDDNFFLYPRPDRAWEMIELAEASGRQDMITKCYILPGSLMYYDLDGETFFTKAVLDRNLRRIRYLVSRPDAIMFMLTENLTSEKNCIDLAIEVHDKNLDPNYSVMINLLPVITSSFYNGKTEKLEDLLEEFVDNIFEADDNVMLLASLENALIAAKDSVEDYEEEEDEEENPKYAFIELLNQKLVEIYEYKLRNENSNSENSSDTELDEPMDNSGNDTDVDSVSSNDESVF